MTGFRAVVLAGERPGGGVLARELNLPAGVLAPLAGRPCLLRVLDALAAAEQVHNTLLCGPDQAVLDGNPELAAALGGFSWQAPAPGPAASALAGVRAGESWPVLITAGDHGLLSGPLVDAFCAAAGAARGRDGRAPDVVVGLVPYDRVARAFPESRRTVLRFADGEFCGSNLFALLSDQGARALEFWSGVEADRKRPWRIARRLGTVTLARYLARQLKVDAAFAILSKRAGCRIGWVPVPCARAAVDVDSRADWELADRLISADVSARGAHLIPDAPSP